MKVNSSVELFHMPAFMKIFTRAINYPFVTQIKFPIPKKKTKRIPTDFMHHVEEVALDTATLTISSGQSWEVRVVKTENDITLEDGWQKFRLREMFCSSHILKT
ncbi:hypothetical protein M9H77_20879 [Catharanthus roseus]|uniref:Uncharacterized protein n=1 Tax=Catharanthus roseus TaxID=4058 RepID=A0ACC0ALF8_CATRO|nr:hypothetical protein M9H77_20879 [Catharanthus roseus]